MSFVLCVVVFETESCYFTLAGVELTMQTRLASSFQRSAYFSLQSAGTKSVYHHPSYCGIFKSCQVLMFLKYYSRLARRN